MRRSAAHQHLVGGKVADDERWLNWIATGSRCGPHWSSCAYHNNQQNGFADDRDVDTPCVKPLFSFIYARGCCCRTESRIAHPLGSSTCRSLSGRKKGGNTSLVGVIIWSYSSYLWFLSHVNLLRERKRNKWDPAVCVDGDLYGIRFPPSIVNYTPGVLFFLFKFRDLCNTTLAWYMRKKITP